MRSLRPTSQAEYDALKVHRQLRTYIDKTPPLETLPPTFRLKIFLKGSDMSKGMLVTRNQKVIELRDTAHDHYVKMVAQNSNGREHSSYTNTQMVLKFAALNEFLDGGELTIDWRESDDHVFMTGPVELEMTFEV